MFPFYLNLEKNLKRKLKGVVKGKRQVCKKTISSQNVSQQTSDDDLMPVKVKSG